MRKEQLLERLEEQSNDPKNDPIIAKMRGLARDIFTYYGIDEFDYKNELQALSSWLSNSKNYDKTFSLVKQSVTLNRNKEDDSQIILGSFALALGNPIKVVEKNGSARIVQYVPTDFASKSGMSGFNGLGEWIVLELSGNNDGNNYGKNQVHKPITLTRDIGTTQEILEHGVGGIKTTALRMKQLTQEYLSSDKPEFIEGKKRLTKWAENVITKKGVKNSPNKYMGMIAGELAKPEVIRYQKDPLKIEKGKLSSHEWLTLADRALFDFRCEDCDGLSICVATFAGLMGLGLEYEIAKCDPKNPNNFTHVYNIINYPDGMVDGFTGTNEVTCDIVYQKRLGGSGYGKRPKNYGTMRIKVW